MQFFGFLMNERMIYVIIKHGNEFFFFSNNVGSYDPRSDPTIYDLTYLLQSYVKSWFWQP